MKGFVIITRHAAALEFAIDWLAARGLHDVTVLGHATPADVAGKIIVGNVPMSLAAKAVAVLAIEFDGDPPRGAEYTAQDMADAGARLTLYTVQAGQAFTIPQGCGLPVVGEKVGILQVTSVRPPTDCLNGEYTLGICEEAARV